MSHLSGDAVLPSPRFVLASASPRRQELLSSINLIPDEICPAKIEEIPRNRETPRLFAERMAEEKAAYVAQRMQESALILGADSVVAVGRRILGKPKDAVEARKFFTLLSGRKHRVYTAICLLPTVHYPQGTKAVRVVETSVTFARLSKDQMDALIQGGEWQDKAGGYALQGQAAAYIRSISGSSSAVIGLPLFETAQLFRGQAGLRGKKRASGDTYWPI
ncbi:septum formation protein Maf [Acetobacteraceae bacterium]|nr:septum formation protein Maf [Acetobacteraceae bacterium]